MRTTLYIFLTISLLATGCSKWNLDDKTIKPKDNSGTTPTSSVVVTLLNLKPTQLGNTSANISFKVDQPSLVAEYGTVLTTDPGQIPALIAGTAAPLRVVGASGVTPDNFPITGLLENSPYYAVPYVKTTAGQYSYGQQSVSFKTKFGQRGNWQQLANAPVNQAYVYNSLFTINGMVYLGGASAQLSPEGFYYFSQLYGYDPVTNLWTKLKDFPGKARSEPTVAVLNNKAYVMFGVAAGGANSYTSDAWEYDPATDNWRQLANPPATKTGGQGVYNMQAGAIPFTYNNKVYALFGRGTYNNDFKQVNIYNSLYALDPTGNGAWDVSFPFNDNNLSSDIIYGAARSSAFSFQYDKWVYFGGGLVASSYNATPATTLPYASKFVSRQIWGYNVDTKELKKMALLPTTFGDCSSGTDSGGRMGGCAFVVGSKAYIIDCSHATWVMDLTTNATPTLVSTLNNPNGTVGIGVGVGTKAYFGLRNADWWVFTPN